MNTTIDNRYIWLGGRIVHLPEAKINVLTPTAQFGANVFEGIRCYWNDDDKQLYAFRLDEHYKRLFQSMKLFQMPLMYTVGELKNALVDTVRANDYTEDIAVRQTVFLDGFGSWYSTDNVNMFVAPIPKQRNHLSENQGIKCGVSSWIRISDRNMSPRAKVGANYINSRMAQLEAREHGYDFPIFLNEQGFVSESSGSCLFLIKNGKVITPDISASVLDSITRKTIIELVKEELGLEVIERNVNRTELYVADEAFLCGSAMEIRGVASIDGYSLGKCNVMSRKIHEIYLGVAMGKNSKYKNWVEGIYEK